jgi:hypothetical protein
MQHGLLKVVICGRWKHCSKVIHQPGVCYCALLSVVRKMGKAKVHVSVEQHIIIKFLTKEGCKPLEICSRRRRQYGERTMSNVEQCVSETKGNDGEQTSWVPAQDFHNRREQWLHQCTHSGEQANNCPWVVWNTEHQWWQCENNLQTTPSILESVHLMDPVFTDGRTQEYKAASGAIIAVTVWAGKGLFLDSTMTTDETWVHYFMPENKHSSMQWYHPGSPKLKKVKTTSSI